MSRSSNDPVVARYFDDNFLLGDQVIRRLFCRCDGAVEAKQPARHLLRMMMRAPSRCSRAT